MPKSLLIHANERIDLEDFQVASRDYTKETASTFAERFVLDRKPKILESFMIEIADQAVSPGQITVYNGAGFDRSGQLVHIEGQPDASLTTTLSGANQSFYVEMQFTETASDVDSRGFWDPTIDNADPIPDGAEALVSVATRNTSSWTIVTPVSTSGFDLTTNPSSTKIPLAVLNTDASNRIEAAVNGFTSLVTASTVLEQDVATLATKIKVVDSRLFPVGSVITIDFGGSSPEVSRTITINDYANNVITFSPGLAGPHLSGAIVRRTGVSGTFLPENADPNHPDFSLTVQDQPNDRQPRLWQGDETRGSGLISSKYTAGTRDDLNLRSVKDYVDSVAATIREMKFGHPRASVTSTAPPTSFSARPRHFDRAGSITGARTNTLSIGNGTTTFGDFNGTTDAVFTAALAALPATGGTIYVKGGTYTFANTVAITHTAKVAFVGEGDSTIITANAPLVGAFSIVNNGIVHIEDILLNGTATYSFIDAASDSVYTLSSFQSQFNGARGTNGTLTKITLGLTDTTVTGQIASDNLSGYANNCKFNEVAITTYPVNLTFDGCEFTNLTTILLTAFDGCDNLKFTNSTFTAAVSNNQIAQMRIYSGTGLVIDNCDITVSSTFVPSSDGTYNAMFLEAVGLEGRMTNCTCEFGSSQTGALTTASYFLQSRSDSFFIDGCVFRSNTPTTYVGAIKLWSSNGKVSISDCFISSVIGVNTRVSSSVAGSAISIIGTHFEPPSSASALPWYGIYCPSGESTHAPLIVSGCSFDGKSQGTGSVAKQGINISITGAELDLIVSSCSFNAIGSSTTVDSKCVNIVSQGGRIAVVDSIFNNLRGATGLKSIQVATTTNYSSIIVANNSIDNVVVTGTVDLLDISGSNLNLSTVSILGNTIQNVTAVGSMNCIKAIQCLGNISANSIRGITVTSGSGTTSGIVAGGVARFVVANNYVTDINMSAGTAVGIKVESNGITITNNAITEINSDSGSATGIFTNFVTEGIIKDNIVTDLSGTTLIYFIRLLSNTTENSDVSGNYISDALWPSGTPTVYGINLNGNSNTKVSDNCIHNLNNGGTGSASAVYGVYCASSDYVSIINNVINELTSIGNGVYVSGSNGVTISKNSITGDFDNGIRIPTGSGNDFIIEGNVINQNISGSRGIYVTSDTSQNILVSSNNVYIEAGNIGIHVSALKASVHNNIVRSSTTAGAMAIAVIASASTGYVNVVGNSCFGATGSTSSTPSAFEVSSEAAVVANNLVQGWHATSEVFWVNFDVGSLTGNFAKPQNDLVTPNADFKGTLNATNVIATGNCGTSTTKRNFSTSPLMPTNGNVW